MSASTRPALIAPSILAADFARLAEEIDRIPSADWVHIDVMDGHFVPNLSFGLPVMRAVAAVTDKPLDVHLMIDNPERWAPDYAADAECVIFHVEATDDPVALARTLRAAGTKAGFSLRPGTPIEPYLEILPEFDEVLVMSVEPGFGGQSFMPDQLEKVRTLRRVIDEQGLDLLIEIDGGIAPRTIAAAAEAGCDAFVAGSAVFGKDDPDNAVQALRAEAVAASPRLQ